MTKPFEQRYGIKVQYEGSRGSSQAAQITTQRAARSYQVDVWMTGFGTIEGLNVQELFEPMESAFLLPEVKDPKNWLNGFLWHDPKDRRFLAHASKLSGGIAVNPNNIKAGQVGSLKDLLKPEYKGRIVSDDPRGAGVGQGLFSYLYLGKEFGFGPGFIKKLIEEQDIAFTRDARQAIDMIVKGRYLIWTAPNSREVAELNEKGVPIEHRCVEDGQWLSIGGGGVGLLNRAPHPNAAVIYLNWLLSQEGQQLFSKGAETSSRRLGVPTNIQPCFVPQPQKNYFWVESPEALKSRAPGGELVRLLKSVYKKN
jgi:iron(III) transport system substrate-binding protein